MAAITVSHHPFIAFTYWILRKITSPFVRFFLIRNISGLDNIPTKTPAILAFNHQSFFDFICCAAIMPRNVHFLSAEKFFEHRWWRKLMLITGQIKVNRIADDKSSVYEAVRSHIEKGMLIGIFPEGTRSPYPDQMLKAFTGVAQFSLRHHVPVIPIGICGTYEIMAKHHTKPKIKKVVEINIGKPLYFDEHYDKHSDQEVCKYVTEVVMKNLEVLSGRNYPHYELIRN